MKRRLSPEQRNRVIMHRVERKLHDIAISALRTKGTKSRRVQINEIAAVIEQARFIVAVEPIIIRYSRALSKRFDQISEEVMRNVSARRRTMGKHARARAYTENKFDASQWLFDRQVAQAKLTQDGYWFAGQALDTGGNYAASDMGINLSFDQTDPRALEYIFGQAKRAGFSISKTAYERLRYALMEAVADGQSIQQLRDTLQFRLSLLKRRATLIARTEMLKASNHGVLTMFKQSGVVEAKQWLAAIDQRTCIMCAEMDGAVMPLDKAFFEQGDSKVFGLGPTPDDYEGPPIPENGVRFNFDYEEIQNPPLHPDCRCCLLGVLSKYPDSSALISRGHLSGADWITAMRREFEATGRGAVTDARLKEYYESVRAFTESSQCRLMRDAELLGEKAWILKNQSTAEEFAKYLKQAEDLNDYMRWGGQWNGGAVYRGIDVASDEGKQFYEFLSKNLDSLSGEALDMTATSHWTSSQAVAESFSDVDGILIEVVGDVRNATSIKHISRYADEEEVAFAKSIFKIEKAEKQGDMIKLYVKQGT